MNASPSPRQHGETPSTAYEDIVKLSGATAKVDTVFWVFDQTGDLDFNQKEKPIFFLLHDPLMISERDVGLCFNSM